MSNFANHNDPNNVQSDALFKSLRIDLGRITYTHKTHEKEIELLSLKASIFNWLELTLISLAAGGAISLLLGTGYYFQLVTAILATLATMVTIYKISFHPEQAALEHRKCARTVWRMRERYINLLCDLYDQSLTNNEGRIKRDELLDELYEIYRDAPNTSQKAFALARKALGIKDETNLTNKELDELLPPSLQDLFDSKTD